MLAACRVSLPDQLLQRFTHTKDFQKWLRGDISLLIASILQRHSRTQSGHFEDADSLLIAHFHIAVALAHCATQTLSGSRIYYINCSSTPPQETPPQQIDHQPAGQETSNYSTDFILELLFLQIFDSHPEPDLLLVQYSMELAESDFLELKMTMMEKGLQPSQHMLRLIDYMLTKSTWGDSILVIGNIGLAGVSDQTNLLAHFESLCASPKTKACIAVPLLPHITTPLYSHLPVVKGNTEYRGTYGFATMNPSHRVSLTLGRILSVTAFRWHESSKITGLPSHSINK